MKRRRIKKKGGQKRTGIALILALIFSLFSGSLYFPGDVRAEAEKFYITKLKPEAIIQDAFFDFYGTFLGSDLLYWIKDDGSPLLCIQKKATLVSGLTGGETTEEFGQSKYLNEKQYELVSLVLQSCGMIRGEDAELAPGTYLAGQAAIWGITSRQQWQGTEHYRREMKKVHACVKDWYETPAEEILEKSQEAVDKICEVIDTYYGDESPYIPAFASKYEKKAPIWQASTLEDGSCEAVFKLDGKSEAVKDFVFEVPEGWSYEWQGDEITFRCDKAKEGLVSIVGRAEKDSLLGDAMPIGLIHIVGPVNYPNFQRLASEVECNTSWSCYFKLEVTEPEDAGSWQLPKVGRYRHQETFEALYGVGVEKVDGKTMEPLAGAKFQPLEYFDDRQLEDTRLDRGQIDTWNGWKENCGPAVTDQEGRLEHWDRREYVYEKTYCGGHPQPEIIYQGSVDSRREQLEKEAQEAWEREVEECEKLCDFHSIEGSGREWLEEDRDITYQQFIQLVYGYAFREEEAPDGYLLPEESGRDKAEETIFLDSLQAGGNVQKEKPGREENDDGKRQPEAEISSHKAELVRAVREETASGSDAKAGELEAEEEEKDEKLNGEEENLPEAGTLGTPSSADRQETAADREADREKGEEKETEEREEREEDSERGKRQKRAKQLRREEQLWLTSLITPLEQEVQNPSVSYQFVIKNDKKSVPEETVPETPPEETTPETPPEESTPEETAPEAPPEETLPQESPTQESLPGESIPSGSHSPGGSGGGRRKVEILAPPPVPETEEVFLLPEDPIPQALSRMGWIEASYATPSIAQRGNNGEKGENPGDLPKTGDDGVGIPLLLLLFAGSGGILFLLMKKRSRALILLIAAGFCIPWAEEALAFPQEASDGEGKKILYFSKEEAASGTGDGWEGEGGEGGIKEKIQDEGQEYWLESCQMVQIPLPEREEWVSEKVEYLAVEAEGQIPECLLFEREEEETGRMGEGELLRTSVSFTEPYWDEDFQISLRFYDYDADSFQLQGREVPGEMALDYLLAHPELLLEAAGCSPSSYQLEGLVWNGESYMVQETLCRDALAYGRKLVSDCTAEYAGQMIYPEEIQEKWEAVYALQTPKVPVQSIEETEALPKPQEVIATRPEALPEKKVFFWQKLYRVVAYTISFAVLLPLLAYFILLGRRQKRLRPDK